MLSRSLFLFTHAIKLSRPFMCSAERNMCSTGYSGFAGHYTGFGAGEQWPPSPVLPFISCEALVKLISSSRKRQTASGGAESFQPVS